MNHSNKIPKNQAHELIASDEHVRFEILEGLARSQKEIHPKYLYDSKGSALFEEICKLKEYYPTRTEISILRNFNSEITSLIGANALLIEFGAGSSIKTRILLRALRNPSGYVPIDISRDFLLNSVKKLNEEFPGLKIHPIAADYTASVTLPSNFLAQSGKKVGFFPGSTLGNFNPYDAKVFLSHAARLLGPGGWFLIGIDLIKDQLQLESAYNDSLGITAAFNLNILTRMNRELGANFDINLFRHRAHFNVSENRIEMHLISLKDQLVTIAGRTFAFREGETIHTENSYKFAPREFENFVETVGFSKLKLWTDPEEMFAVYLLEVKAREF
jgi:dimethylhistidine N-methyltransferase